MLKANHSNTPLLSLYSKSLGWCRFILRWCLFVCWNSLTFGCPRGPSSSVPLLSIASLGVLRHEDGSRPQGVALFLLNAGLALLSASAGLSIGHAENIVSLDTAVESAVSWDGVSELLSLILGLINTVEHTESVFIGFLSLSVLSRGVLETNGLWFVGFLLHVIRCVNTVELVNSWCRNGLNELKVRKAVAAVMKS